MKAPQGTLREFLFTQLPIFIGLVLLGYAAAMLQHGFLPDEVRGFPIAAAKVPVWHLVWMGLWTGYTLALVGQAAGIFALPYSTSVLQFDNAHVTPTMLILTFLNPIGALLGFRRSGQWNLDLAIAVCIGGFVGGVVGPILRVSFLSDPLTFRLVLGAALAAFGLQLCVTAARSTAAGRRMSGRDWLHDPAAEPSRGLIRTVHRSVAFIDIQFGQHSRTISNLTMLVLGAGVGVISAALGVGGAFLLVPLLGAIYRLPVYVIVAATIPYTIVLSTAGILTFVLLLPLFGEPAVTPEWSWGLFTSAGGLLGAWCGAKAQMEVPEHLLSWMLGGVTALAGAGYVIKSSLALFVQQ